MEQYSIMTSCITTTQIITTKVTTSKVISSTGEQSTLACSRVVTNQAAPESTLSYLRNFRQQPRVITNKQYSEAADIIEDSDEQENSDKQSYSRVSVICSNRNKARVHGNILEQKIETSHSPQPTRHCPQPTRQCPQSSEQCPQSLEQCPQLSAHCTQSSEKCTQSIEQYPKAPQFPTSNTIDCPICSALAVDHLHYGGFACFSCKAFFRRMVVMHNNKPTR